jgi:methionyl-tRNA synthetase
VVIYVRDVLERYQPDALRYFIAVAGPERRTPTSPGPSSCAAPTTSWSRAGATWSTARLDGRKNFGEVPAAGRCEPVDEALLTPPPAERSTPSAASSPGTGRRPALGEAMRVVARPTPTCPTQAPWKLRRGPGADAAPCCTSLQAVVDCNTPAVAVPAALGSDRPQPARSHRDAGPQPEIREVDDLDDGPRYPVLMGSYDTGARWESEPIVPGTPIQPPVPVFTKLDPSIVEEELERLERAAAS